VPEATRQTAAREQDQRGPSGDSRLQDSAALAGDVGGSIGELHSRSAHEDLHFRIVLVEERGALQSRLAGTDDCHTLTGQP
jgi:hypothetical protein